MLKPLKRDTEQFTKRLNIAGQLDNRKALTQAARAIDELVGEGNARPVKIERGILYVECQSTAAAHYLKMNEDRLKIVSNAERIRYRA